MCRRELGEDGVRLREPRWEWLQALGAGPAPSLSTWRSLWAKGGQSLPPMRPAPWLSCDGVMVQGHSLLAWGEVMCPRLRGHCPQSQDGAAGVLTYSPAPCPWHPPTPAVWVILGSASRASCLPAWLTGNCLVGSNQCGDRLGLPALMRVGPRPPAPARVRGEDEVVLYKLPWFPTLLLPGRLLAFHAALEPEF